MGKLRDILNGRKANEIAGNEKVPEDTNTNVLTNKYTRTWASRIALHQGFTLSSDDKKVDGILSALNRRDGQCPCGGNGAQYKCPCIIMRKNGICKCGLFQTIEDRKVTSTSSTAKIKVDNE